MIYSVYNIAISLYAFCEGIIGFFHTKTAKRNAKLKNWERILSNIKKESNQKEVIWIHAASLGEFEQGRPIIDELFKRGYFILLSFYSPSGFELRKDYKNCNAVIYLPVDTAKNASKFVNILQPKFAIFIKYEFWWNYLKALSNQAISTFFISTSFRKNQYFFKPLFKDFRNQLKKVNTFFVQDQMSLDIAYQFKLDAILAGDTRLDNVIARAANSKPIDFIERRINKNKPIIIYGSIYKDDLDKISSFINTNEEYTHIVVPHDVSVENISQIEKYINLPYTITSKIENENQAKVILVDSIGLLFDLYQYADIAYIGGGFKKGIHNILEPLAYNIPVIFGSKYSKFNEANQAVNQNFAFSINSIEDFEEKINYIRTEKAEIKERIIEWKNSNKGATDRILACL